MATNIEIKYVIDKKDLDDTIKSVRELIEVDTKAKIAIKDATVVQRAYTLEIKKEEQALKSQAQAWRETNDAAKAANLSQKIALKETIDGTKVAIAGQKELARQMNQVQIASQNNKQSLLQMAGSLSNMTTASIMAARALVDMGDKFLEVEKKAMSAKSVIGNLLGVTAKEVERIRNVLFEMSQKMGESFQSIQSGYTKLLVRGLQPTKKELEGMVGLATISGKSFDQLAEAILDAQTGEKERLKEFGIKMKTDGDMISLTLNDVTVKAKTMAAAFGELGSSEKFLKIMDDRAHSVGAEFQRLKNDFDKFIESLINSPEAGRGLIKFVEFIKTLWDGFVYGLEVAMGALESFFKIFNENATAGETFKGFLKIIVVGLFTLQRVSIAVVESFGYMFRGIKTMINALATGDFKTAFVALGRTGKLMGRELVHGFKNGFDEAQAMGERLFGDSGDLPGGGGGTTTNKPGAGAKKPQFQSALKDAKEFYEEIQKQTLLAAEKKHELEQTSDEAFEIEKMKILEDFNQRELALAKEYMKKVVNQEGDFYTLSEKELLEHENNLNRIYLDGLKTSNKIHEQSFDERLKEIDDLSKKTIKGIEKHAQAEAKEMEKANKKRNLISEKSDLDKAEISQRVAFDNLTVQQATYDMIAEAAGKGSKQEIAAREELNAAKEKFHDSAINLAQEEERYATALAEKYKQISNEILGMSKNALQGLGPLGNAFANSISIMQELGEYLKKNNEYLSDTQKTLLKVAAALEVANQVVQAGAAVAQAIADVQIASIDKEIAHRNDNIKAIEDETKAMIDRNSNIQEIENKLAENRIKQLEFDKETMPEGQKARVEGDIQSEKDRIKNIEKSNKQIEKSQKQKIDAEKKGIIELEKDKQRIQSKNFEIQRAAQIAGIAINTAVAIMNIWATVPKVDFGAMSAVLTGVAIATGAVQAGLVAAQPNPYKFSKGTLSVPGTGTGDSVPAMLTPGEAVIPAQLSKQYAPILDAIFNQTLPYDMLNNFAKNGKTDGGRKIEADFAKESAKIVRAINEKEFVRMNLDEHGFEKFAVSAQHKERILNKKLFKRL